MNLVFNGKDKFISVMDRIAQSGIYLIQDNLGYHCSDPIAAQAIIDAFTLDEAKTYICELILQKGKNLRDEKLQSVSPGEMASWYMKLAEARVFSKTGNAEDAPALALEAQVRGVSLADLCALVDANAQALSSLEAVIAGNEGRHKDAVKLLQSFDAVAEYDYSTGWPAI